jgi:glutamyl-tRNA(Gln) amidotransferase subunit E
VLKKAAKASEQDAVVFVADSPDNDLDALRAVVERAKEAINGVPAETRGANTDGTTKYMRPRPGAARMYPETDIPPTLVTEDFVERVRSNLPEPAEKKIERLKKEYNLNEKLAKQIADSEYGVIFENIAKQRGVTATTVAAFLTETLKSLRREGVEVEKVTDDQVREIFNFVGSGDLAKEAIADVFSWLSKHEDKTVQHAVESLGLKMVSREELEKLVSKVIFQNKQSVDMRDKNVFGQLMGMVMKEVRGKANPELVIKILKEKLK